MIIQVNTVYCCPSSDLYYKIEDAIWRVLDFLHYVKKGDKKNAALQTLLESSKFAEKNETYLKYLQGWIARDYSYRISIKILTEYEIQDMLKILKQEKNEN